MTLRYSNANMGKDCTVCVTMFYNSLFQKQRSLTSAGPGSLTLVSNIYMNILGFVARVSIFYHCVVTNLS